MDKTSNKRKKKKYLDENLELLQPVAVVLEEILQLPDVLQEVSPIGSLAQRLLEQPGVLRHVCDVLHQHLLPLRPCLGARHCKGRGGTKHGAVVVKHLSATA